MNNGRYPQKFQLKGNFAHKSELQRQQHNHCASLHRHMLRLQGMRPKLLEESTLLKQYMDSCICSGRLSAAHLVLIRDSNLRSPHNSRHWKHYWPDIGPW